MGAIWENLFNEHLTDIAQRLEYLEDVTSFSAVCKSWNFVASEWMEKEKPWLPTRNPWLLLAEDTGADLNAVLVGSLEAYSKDYEEEDDDEGDDNVGYDDEGDNSNLKYANDKQMKREVDLIITSISDLFKNTSSFRGLFSLKARKLYDLDLPEAMDKLILGTNKGCLVTLGRDLEINLLHPLLRYQIPLPRMLTFPCQYNYDDDFFPQQVSNMFITKVVMSSTIPTKSGFKDPSHIPIVMAIYGEFRILGFARLGDKLWQDVETSSRVFEDIVYHKEDFYAIDCHGSVFLCDIEKEQKGKIITSIPMEKEDMDQSYLIESLSGSHLWVVLRSRSGEYFKTGPEPFIPGELRYYTSDFIVFKLEVQYSNSNDNPTCHWTRVKDLENEALFIGRSSSVSIASSKFIEPNSIYFTDDMSMYFCDEGGGHDMGVFNVKTSTIQPHYDGVSIHPYSPPVWYI